MTAPAVAANQSGQLSAFLIGKNGGALYRYDQAASGAWGSPQSMGGTWLDVAAFAGADVGAPVVVVANQSGQLSAFLISQNTGALNRYDQAPSGAWGSPQSMGGDWLYENVALVVVANHSGQLSAFLFCWLYVCIGAGALERYDQAASGAWGSPQSMGGTWPGAAPVVVANQSGQLSAFLIGENGTLYRYDQAASGAWGSPQSMAGTWPGAEPVVVANQSGQLSAFLIGKNGALYRYDQAASGAWGPPQSMGGDWP